MKALTSANIVIVARTLNPSIFSQLWLVEEKIVSKEDLAEDYVYTPMVTQVSTPDFRMDVFPERMQVALTDKSMGSPKPVIDKIVNIIRKLPHTPYTAIGANLHWIVAPDVPENFVGFMRGLFVKPEVPLYDEFSESNARFGGYMSRDFLGTRLKVDIKPMREEKNGEVVEFLRFNFNYHLNLEHGKHIKQMEEFLGNWDSMKDKSEEIVSFASNNSG